MAGIVKIAPTASMRARIDEIIAEELRATGQTREQLFGRARKLSTRDTDLRHKIIRRVNAEFPALSYVSLGKVLGLHGTTVGYALDPNGAERKLRRVARLRAMGAMACPSCGGTDLPVLLTEPRGDNQTYRSRECRACGLRIKTMETIVTAAPKRGYIKGGMGEEEHKLRRAALEEARASGRTRDEVLAEWRAS